MRTRRQGIHLTRKQGIHLPKVPICLPARREAASRRGGRANAHVPPASALCLPPLCLGRRAAAGRFFIFAWTLTFSCHSKGTGTDARVSR